MFGFGMGELLIILAVILLIMGPKKLPQLASGLGTAIRSFKKSTQLPAADEASSSSE